MKIAKHILFGISVLWASSGFSQDKITVMLSWFMNPNYGNFVIADKKGFFDTYNLDVDYIEPANPSDPPKFLAVKKVDYALGHQPSLQLSAGKNWNISRVATMISGQMNSLVYLQKSGIKTISDLKGKTIGYSIPGFDDVLLKTVLASGGLRTDDVKMVNINWAIASSLLSGKVDAVIGTYRTYEQIEIELKGERTGAFYLEENGVPLYDEVVMLAHNDSRNSDVTKRLILALRDATHYIVNNPDTAWDIFVSSNPEKLNTKLNKRAWMATYPRLSLSPSALDTVRYIHFADYLWKNKLSDAPIPALNTYAIDPFASQ